MSGQERKRPHESSSSDEENKQAATNKRLDKMSEDQAATNKRLDEMSEDHAATNKRLDEMSEDQAATNKRLDDLGRRFGSIEVEEIAQLEFSGNIYTGLGCHGEIVLAKENTGRYLMFKYDGNKYTTIMDEDLPDGTNYLCHKAINSSGNSFFQQSPNEKTFCCNREGKVIFTMPETLCGVLLDSEGDRLIYGEGQQNWCIQIYECTQDVPQSYRQGWSASEQQGSWRQLTSVRKLKPPQMSENRNGCRLSAYWALSVCRGESDRYFVVESCGRSLHIFTGKGEHIKQIALTYDAAFPHGVTAWSGYILVAAQQPPELHIYTECGEHVTSKTHNQLGLDANEKVKGIHCDRNRVLHMILGHDNIDVIKSLKAFKLLR